MINLLYSANNNYFKGVLLSLMSIIKHTKEELHVYILSIDLTDLDKKFEIVRKKNILEAEKLLKEVNNNSTIELIDMKDIYLKNFVSDRVERNKYSPYAYLRLLASKVNTLPNKLLYLDTDIMCLKDIKPLFEIDITNYDYAMARDQVGKYFFSNEYCNSGVLLLNLERLRLNKILDKCYQYMMKNKVSQMPDQDALNKISDDILIIDNIYNEQIKIKSNTVLYHFNQKTQILPLIKFINVKQWEFDEVHAKLQIFEFDDIFDKFDEIKDNFEF